METANKRAVSVKTAIKIARKINTAADYKRMKSCQSELSNL